MLKEKDLWPVQSTLKGAAPSTALGQQGPWHLQEQCRWSTHCAPCWMASTWGQAMPLVLHPQDTWAGQEASSSDPRGV